MQDTQIGIQGNLVNVQGHNIDLIVYSLNLGHPSPYAVIENGEHLDIVGGYCKSLDDAFKQISNRHHGYQIKNRASICLATN